MWEVFIPEKRSDKIPWLGFTKRVETIIFLFLINFLLPVFSLEIYCMDPKIFIVRILSIFVTLNISQISEQSH